MYVPVISYYFRQTFAKKQFTLANSAFNFRQRSFWHTKGHRILHSSQGPFGRYPHGIFICILDSWPQATPSHVCRLNCLNIKAWELISSFGIKHLGANNAIPRRQQKCRWHQKKQQDLWLMILCTTQIAHQERMPYESALSHCPWSFLKRRCFISEWALCVSPKWLQWNDKANKHLYVPATCQVAKSHVRSKMCQEHLVWLQHAPYDHKWMNQWNSTGRQKQGQPYKSLRRDTRNPPRATGYKPFVSHSPVRTYDSSKSHSPRPPILPSEWFPRSQCSHGHPCWIQGRAATLSRTYLDDCQDVRISLSLIPSNVWLSAVRTCLSLCISQPERPTAASMGCSKWPSQIAMKQQWYNDI